MNDTICISLFRSPLNVTRYILLSYFAHLFQWYLIPIDKNLLSFISLNFIVKLNLHEYSNYSLGIEYSNILKTLRKGELTIISPFNTGSYKNYFFSYISVLYSYAGLKNVN